MTKWEFLFGSDRVEVDGTTWLDALGKALGAAGLDSSVLTRLHIDVQPGDRVVVKDPAGRKMVLQPVPAGDQAQPDMDLFSIPPDLETEEIPRTSEGRPMPRRGPKPRATNWRVPTATSPTPDALRTPRPPDPSLAVPPLPAILDSDEPPTEEVDPAQLASALAAAHAQAAPSAPVPKKPAAKPAPPPAGPPPAPAPTARTKPRRLPRRGAPPLPSMAPPMAPLAGPMTSVLDAPPSSLDAPPSPLEPPAAIEPVPAVLEAPVPEAVEAPAPELAEPPAPPVIERPQPIEPPPAPPPPPGILPIIPADAPPSPTTPVDGERSAAPQQLEELDEPVSIPSDQALVEPAPLPDEPQPTTTVFDEVEVPAAPPAPEAFQPEAVQPEPEPTPEPAQDEPAQVDPDIDRLAATLEPLLGRVMDNLEQIETRGSSDLPPAEELPAPPSLDLSMAETVFEEAEIEPAPGPDTPEAEQVVAAADDAQLPPPPVLEFIEPMSEEIEIDPPSEELPPPPVIEPATDIAPAMGQAATEAADAPSVVEQPPEPELPEPPPPAPAPPEPELVPEPQPELVPEPQPEPIPEPEPLPEPEPIPEPELVPAPAPPPPPAPEPAVDQVLAAKPTDAAPESYDDALPPGFEDDDEPMAIDMEVFGPARPVKPPDLGEWLFEKSMDINEAMDIPDAARMSLQILLDLVSAESGCVLYGDYNAEALEFIAAAGPTAHKLQGVTVEIENSLAGFCHRMGFGILVADAAEDNRFDRSVDEHTGYNTEAILAVPIRATDGDTYGCMELLNAYWGFEEWMMDASQNIATTLAGYIQARL